MKTVIGKVFKILGIIFVVLLIFVHVAVVIFIISFQATEYKKDKSIKNYLAEMPSEMASQDIIDSINFDDYYLNPSNINTYGAGSAKCNAVNKPSKMITNGFENNYAYWLVGDNKDILFRAYSSEDGYISTEYLFSNKYNISPKDAELNALTVSYNDQMISLNLSSDELLQMKTLAYSNEEFPGVQILETGEWYSNNGEIVTYPVNWFFNNDSDAYLTDYVFIKNVQDEWYIARPYVAYESMRTRGLYKVPNSVSEKLNNCLI